MAIHKTYKQHAQDECKITDRIGKFSFVLNFQNITVFRKNNDIFISTRNQAHFLISCNELQLVGYKLYKHT